MIHVKKTALIGYTLLCMFLMFGCDMNDSEGDQADMDNWLGGSDCPKGDPGCRCMDDGTCQPGWTCFSNFCVSADGGTHDRGPGGPDGGARP